MKIQYEYTGQDDVAKMVRKCSARKRAATIKAKDQARKFIAILVAARP